MQAHGAINGFWIDDVNEIESIYLETGGPIQLGFVPGLEEDTNVHDEWRYFLNELEVKKCYYPERGGVGFTIIPNGLVSGNINIEDADLSQLSDYIKINVAFKDGTVENHLIDILVTRDGQMSAIYRGQPVGV
ncbi:MAG: hypothetical protein E7466_07365 [Ruminococcaceae bacterium]|nr:hypothetical protein [Oscillospiraceae bacterium]